MKAAAQMDREQVLPPTLSVPGFRGNGTQQRSAVKTEAGSSSTHSQSIMINYEEQEGRSINIESTEKKKSLLCALFMH